MHSTITHAPTAAAAGRARTRATTWIATAAVALATVGGLLWAAQTERVEAPPPTAAQDVRPEVQADAVRRPATERVQEWEDWHGNWFVSPRGRGPSSW